MAEFNPRGVWTRELDVRDWSRFVDRIKSGPPRGSLWLLVGTRRSGKTWGLRALNDELGGHEINLRDEGSGALDEAPAGLVIIDEPGSYLRGDDVGRSEARHRPERFLEWCHKRKRNGAVVLALTPGELSMLEVASRGLARIDSDDREFVGPLDARQARQKAQRNEVHGWRPRADWVEGLIDELLQTNPNWARNPFLIELVLSIAESSESRDLPDLLVRAKDQLNTGFDYTAMVYEQGLADSHRDVLRTVGWGGRASDATTMRLLISCGIVHEQSEAIADPLVREHLPAPLIIHHVSDLHFGPKHAEDGDNKLGGALGETLGAGMFDAVSNSYLEHLRRLRAEGRGPHLLVVSGDLAEYAKPEQYAPAVAWLQRAREELSDHPLVQDQPRLLLVGGNHDVDWTDAEFELCGPHARHTAFAQALSDGGFTSSELLHPNLHIAPNERELVIARYGSELAIVLLGSAEFGGQIDRELRTKIDLALDQIIGDAASEEERQAAQDYRKEHTRLDPGLVHRTPLAQLRAEYFDESVRLAVLHHPLAPIAEAQELARFAGLLNAGRVKEALLDKRFHLALHGHVHVGWFGKESWPGQFGDHPLHIASAATLSSRETIYNQGFNVVAIRREGEERSVSVHRVERRGGSWEEAGAPMTFGVEARGV